MLSGIWMGITSLFGGGLSFTVKLMARHLSLSEPSLITYLKVAPNNLSVTVLLTGIFYKL